MDATGAFRGRSWALCERCVKGRPRRGKKLRVRTYPCDNWYQSQVVRLWDIESWLVEILWEKGLQGWRNSWELL